ncbi:hypothetical protein ACWDA3_16500 [Nonomuraea rubra]
MKNGDAEQARAYFDAVVTCLETTWEKHLSTAGLDHEPVKVKHVAKFPKKWCDMETYKSDSQVWYCEKTRTVGVQIGGYGRWYGKTSTQRSWLKKGFSTGDPGSCNTWTASSSKVA